MNNSTPEENYKFKKFLPYALDGTNYELAYKASDDILAFMIKKEHAMSHWLCKVEFEKMQDQYIKEIKFFYGSVEEFTESFYEKVNSKEIFLEEHEDHIELSFYEVIRKNKKIKILFTLIKIFIFLFLRMTS